MTLPLGPWSKSGLGSILDGCSWAWYLEKVVKLATYGSPATLAGTGYHAALEHHERTRILHLRDHVGPPTPTFDELVAIASTTIREGAPALPGEQWDKHETNVEDTIHGVEVALDHWWSAAIPAGQLGAGGSMRGRLLSMRPVAVEPYFRVAMAATRYGMHGFIDWLGYDHEGGSWVVVDHKTAGSFRRWPLGGGGHEVEAGAYLVGAEVSHGLPVAGPARMEWHVTRKETGGPRFQPVRVVHSDNLPMLREVLDIQLAAADGRVDRREFVTNTAWNLCSPKWCPHYEGCQVTGELHPDRLLP